MGQWAARNGEAHDKIAKSYDVKHTEIFNQVEQQRIWAKLRSFISGLGYEAPYVLDFGAGTGNLTKKLLQLDCKVMAVDVSGGVLAELRRDIDTKSALEVKMITGGRLPFDDCTFDAAVTYSVLHHIPDYVFAIKELIRVVKPGGRIYIDHEKNENAWQPDSHLQEYLSLTRQNLAAHIRKLYAANELFTWEMVRALFIKLFIDKRYKREGDIHVWPDDHIEWGKIKAAVAQEGAKVYSEEDYLHYRPLGGEDLFKQYSLLCNDTKLMIIEKL